MAHLAGTQNIANGARTTVAFDTIDSDPNGNFTTGASANYVVPISGLYWMNAVIQFASGAFTQACLFGFLKNGSSIPNTPADTELNTTNFGVGVNMAGGIHALLVAGDVITVQAQQNTGGNLNITGSSFSIEFRRHT